MGPKGWLGTLGLPFPQGVPKRHAQPFNPEAFPLDCVWTWLKNITCFSSLLEITVYQGKGFTFPGSVQPAAPHFPRWDHRPCWVGFGHSLHGLHPRLHPVLSRPDPGFSERKGLPLSLHPAVPHPLHSSHGNRLESVPLPHPSLQNLLLPEPPVPLLSVSTLTSPLTA